MITAKNYNFSFSGLKTAVLYHMRDFPKASPADICASFQAAAVDVLVTKTIRAAKEFGAKSISLSGGVSANQALREKLKAESIKLKLEFFVPPPGLSTDNAEMIGIAAAFALANGTKPVPINKIQANPSLQL